MLPRFQMEYAYAFILDLQSLFYVANFVNQTKLAI